MTNKERRYKIEKIEKYDYELNLEKTNNLTNTILLGSGALLLVAGIIGGSDIMNAVDYISIFSGAGMSIPGIMRYVKSISKQTILEGKIDDLQNKLKDNSIIVNDKDNIIENGESKGMKR